MSDIINYRAKRVRDYKKLFDHYFEVVLADTPDLRREVFRTRYQVYCEEGLVPDFEPYKYPNGLEQDEFDAHSLHSLLYHRSSGLVAGTVRLVRCNPTDPKVKFPIESFAEAHVKRDVLALDCARRDRIAEISRLVLTKPFRSRAGEQFKPYGFGDSQNVSQIQDDRRHFPHTVLGLLVAITRMSAEHEITHWYAAMEPSLNRLLRIFSVDLDPIGPVIEYHGARTPFLSKAGDVLGKAHQKNRPIWDLLTDRGKFSISAE